MRREEGERGGKRGEVRGEGSRERGGGREERRGREEGGDRKGGYGTTAFVSRFFIMNQVPSSTSSPPVLDWRRLRAGW